MSISIEDLYEDVLGKARGGLEIGDDDLRGRAGLDAESYAAVMGGTFDEGAVRRLAPLLQLDADALVELGRKAWHPSGVTLEGLRCYNTPFPVPGYAEMTVNAFLAWDPATRRAVAFDTGGDASAMIATIEEEGLTVDLVLLTHTHDDHIADLARLRAAAGDPPVYVNALEPVPGAELFEAGRTFTVGGLSIESRLTHGHSPGGTTFVITGLGRTVAIVGDSLFCCSQGGAASHYATALENNRTQVLSLPDDTVLCPGHGPVTTVGEEKVHNPFFAGLE